MHGSPDNPTVSPDASWMMIASTISKGGLGAVNVIDEASSRNNHRWRSATLAGESQSGASRETHRQSDNDKNPVVVSPNQLAYDALQLMENRPLNRRASCS